MPVEVILPKVDMDMESGQISRWHVQEGAPVRKGDVLFEIETNKAAMEIEAPASGVLRDVSGKEGVDIPVGQAVAWIYAEGEAYQGAKAASSAPEGDRAGGRSEGGPDGNVPASTGAMSSASSQDAAAQAAPSVPHTADETGAVRASPLARRLARENGISLSSVAGSGPHGRIVRTDVEAAIAQVSTTPLRGGRAEGAGGGISSRAGAFEAPPPTPPLKGEGDSAVLRLFEEGSYDLVPHDNMRRTIARRLVEAKSTVPHFYLTVDCEIDALLALRRQINDAAPKRKTETGEEPAWKLSVNDLVVKAYAMALAAVPDANVSWTEAAMVRHRHADVGVAVSIPGGLITPIIRRAEEKPPSAISSEMRDLAARARLRKLKPEEFQGGTGAVSNLGMFGIRNFAAVINPPHATILAVGAGEERAVVKNGAIAIATVMSVTLSTDHRAVDGALGAELLAAFRRYVENPLAMLA